MSRFDVIIAGGGLVGASLALALSDVTVALVEPQLPRPLPNDGSWDSRIYTLSPGNAAWLAELGVWGTLPAERLTRVEAMRVFGDAGAELRFGAYDAGLRELAWTVENRVLQDALWSALRRAAHVEIISPGRCADVEWSRDSARLRLGDGRALETRLIVGADGADSWVRERAGIAANLHEYGQLGVVANFETERGHEDTAFQWFRHDGVLAFLPLPGRRVSIVWSTGEAHAKALLAASPDELEHEVMHASHETLGQLRLITPAAAFPLQRLRVSALVEPRAALVGDAAHNVHPLAGQGMNLGLRDARALAHVITNRGAQRDCGDYALLRRYERARREDILTLELTTDGLEKLFSSDAVWSRARNIGLSFVNTQPQLKNLLVRQAIA